MRPGTSGLLAFAVLALICKAHTLSAPSYEGVGEPCKERVSTFEGLSACGGVSPAFSSRFLSVSPPLLALRGGGDAASEGDKKPFNLDAWKRLYTNTEDTESILDEFWSTLDTEGYSIWFSEYKHNEDYTKKLMASNLIGGFFQRLDNAGGRKVSFANVHVFGKEPSLELAGCWLIKGQDIPQDFKDVADFDQWEWTKADIMDSTVRKTVNDYWRWDGDFGKGRTWAAGKTYK